MELEGWDIPAAAYIASLCQFQLISLPSHYGRGWQYPQLGLPSTSARSTTARQGQQAERKRRECPGGFVSIILNTLMPIKKWGNSWGAST
jgi:hypothetical protein